MKKLTINRLFLAILSCCALVACDGIGNAPENTQSSASGGTNNEATTLATSITESDPAVQAKYKIVGKIVNHNPCVGNLSMGCGFESGHGTQEQPYLAYPLKLYHVDVVYTNDSRNSVMQFKTHITPNTGNWSRTTWGCQNKTLNPSQSCTDTYSMMDNTPGDHNLLPLEQQLVTWYSVDERTYSERVFKSPIYVTISTESKDPRADRKIMFVTNGTYPTNMNEHGHHKGGDAICNTEALKLGEPNPHFYAVNEHSGHSAFKMGTEYYRKDRVTKIFTTHIQNYYYGEYYNSIESVEYRKADFSNYVDYDGRPILAYYWGSGCGDWSNYADYKNPDYNLTYYKKGDRHNYYDDREFITEKVQQHGATYRFRNAFSDNWEKANNEYTLGTIDLFFETPFTDVGRYRRAYDYLIYKHNYESSVKEGLCHDDAEATGQNHPERYNLHLLCVQQ